MKNKLFCALFLLAILSCSKDEYNLPKCEFNDATQDLAWLKGIIEDRESNPTEDMKYCWIEQAKLNGKTVFIFEDCNPLINKAILVMDCEGNAIKDKDGKEIYARVVTLRDQRIIWKPVDFACNL